MQFNTTRLLAAVTLAYGASFSAQAATITISCGSNAADVEYCGK